MIVTVACGDGEARTLFHENDIGDTDGDGAPEFLDGWGRPISFIRWAPGFHSQIQGNAANLGPPFDTPGQNPQWEAAASADHDPFDVYRIDPSAFRLVPVVISSGGDEQLGIETFQSVAVMWSGATYPLAATPSYPFFRATIRPYQPMASGSPPVYMGAPLAEGAADNIHNHSVSERLRVQR
jgi:hypothetical protein